MAIHKEVKSVLNKSRERDNWFLNDYSVNPYSGCSFNCMYCYIRGSKYGLHMERKLVVKSNAAELLDKQLYYRAKKEQYGFIVLASATEPYLQLEGELKMTRQMLEVILKHRFPVHIITKSGLVERDFDLIAAIGHGAILPTDFKGKLNTGALLTFSFSTLQDEVARIFEPGATLPSVRQRTVKMALKNNIHTGISMMPLLPFISDTTESLNEMFQTFSAIGVKYLMPATLTLFGNDKSDGKSLTFNAIEKHYPELLQKYQKYFKHSHQMPAYYQKAFSKKMKEMAIAYNLPDRIIKP
jgi:DNA repair photolyase